MSIIGSCIFQPDNKRLILRILGEEQKTPHEESWSVWLIFDIEQACSTSSLNCKFAVTHDGEAIHFDGAASRDDIDVNFGIPIGACKFGIRIAKGNV